MRLSILKFYTASFRLLSLLSAVQAVVLKVEEILIEVVTYTACKPSLDSISVGCVGTPEQFDPFKAYWLRDAPPV
jgi:hypothetical protein